MTNKLRDELALTAVNTYRIRKGLLPVSTMKELDTECMEDALAEAQAIIDHLAPTMRRVVENLKKCDDLFYEIRCDWSDPRSECREGRENIEKALASLSEWQEKGE